MKVYELRQRCRSDWPLAVYQELPRPTHEPIHGHNCYEIMVAVKSGGVCSVGNSHYAIHAGSIFLCKPNDEHEFTLPMGNSIYNIMFLPEIFNDHARKMLEQIPSGAYLIFQDSSLDQLLSMLAVMERELITQRPGFEALTGALTQYLLTSIFRRNNELPDLTRIEHNDELEKVIFYVQNHYREKITLAKLSKLTGRSTQYIGQLFKKNAWCSFSQYLMRYRVNKAQDLLKNTDLSLTEITYETGFFDSAHFTKSFSSVVGQTPLAYRRNAADD